jgi:hypothetical protein
LDNVVLPECQLVGAKRLEELGHTVQSESYPEAHNMHPRQVPDVMAWIRARLQAAAN